MPPSPLPIPLPMPPILFPSPPPPPLPPPGRPPAPPVSPPPAPPPNKLPILLAIPLVIAPIAALPANNTAIPATKAPTTPALFHIPVIASPRAVVIALIQPPSARFVVKFVNIEVIPVIAVENKFNPLVIRVNTPDSINALFNAALRSRIVSSKVAIVCVAVSRASCSASASSRVRPATFIICGIASNIAPISGFARRKESIICFCSAAVPEANPDNPSTLFSNAVSKI